MVPGKLCNCRTPSKSACKTLTTSVWPVDDCLTRLLYQAVEHLFIHFAYRLCSMSTATYRDPLHICHMATHNDRLSQTCRIVTTLCAVAVMQWATAVYNLASYTYLNCHPQCDKHGPKIQTGSNNTTLLKHFFELCQRSHQEHGTARQCTRSMPAKAETADR